MSIGTPLITGLLSGQTFKNEHITQFKRKENITANRLQTNIADHRTTFKNHFETPRKVLQNLWHRANLIFSIIKNMYCTFQVNRAEVNEVDTRRNHLDT